MQEREVMREIAPEERVKNFNEVSLGYTKEEALKEAKRCLQCKKPLCVTGCPVEINIPGFIKLIAEGKFKESIELIKEKDKLPRVTGRVCPQEIQCEFKCVLGKKGEPVAIGNLERFVADLEERTNYNQIISPSTSAKKVAVIGSGPASLTCAGECAKLGFDVTIFEALHDVGGVLRYGIPNFRLSQEILDYEIEYLKSLGIKIKINVAVGLTVTLDDLKKEGYEVFFIGTGAGVPHFLNIENENLNGVYSANEFLTRINLMKAYLFPKYDTPTLVGDKAIVIGGGNVAIDAARTLIRLGLSEVSVVYRRTISEMPARKPEIDHAMEEGIKFSFLTSPVAFIDNGEGYLKGLKCQSMELSEPDENGRKGVRAVKNEIFDIYADTAIIAIGQEPNPILASRLGLELDKKGHILVNPKIMQTSIDYIFAGGDITTGAATVISAMGAGKQAAEQIKRYLSLDKRS